MRKEGNNPYTNRIYVDFEKKTIRFVPIERKKIMIYYVTLLLGIFMMYLLLFWMPLMIIFSIILYFDNSFSNIFNVMTTYAMIQFVLMSIYFSLFYWRGDWRKKYYPIFNFKMSLLLNSIFSLKRKKPEKQVVNHEAIINNQFFMPHFKNIYLKYNVTKDFAVQLKNIKISNLFNRNPRQWFCLFEFYKKPKDGNLIVEYL